MLVALMIIPATMVVIGSLWRHRPPATINWLYGYRTGRSMKNQATWDFAHRHLAELWFRFGLALAAASLGYWVIIRGSNAQSMEHLIGVTVLTQVALMLVPVVMTEVALSRRFDRDGNLL